MERIDDLNLNGKKIIQDTELFLFGIIVPKVTINGVYSFS